MPHGVQEIHGPYTVYDILCVSCRAIQNNFSRGAALELALELVRYVTQRRNARSSRQEYCVFVKIRSAFCPSKLYAIYHM